VPFIYPTFVYPTRLRGPLLSLAHSSREKAPGSYLSGATAKKHSTRKMKIPGGPDGWLKVESLRLEPPQLTWKGTPSPQQPQNRQLLGTRHRSCHRLGDDSSVYLNSPRKPFGGVILVRPCSAYLHNLPNPKGGTDRNRGPIFAAAATSNRIGPGGECLLEAHLKHHVEANITPDMLWMSSG
jgi:hypothetical protein